MVLSSGDTNKRIPGSRKPCNRGQLVRHSGREMIGLERSHNVFVFCFFWGDMVSDMWIGNNCFEWDRKSVTLEASLNGSIDVWKCLEQS